MKKFQGIIPPMITPLLKTDELDKKGLEKTINRMIDGGIHGLFVLGTTGEAPNLSHRLRKELIQATQKIVHDRLPILVGITDTSIEEIIDLAHFAKDHGAAAVVIAPPFYAPISQSELLNWLELLIPQLPLPVMLYNMPSHTKISISVATVEKMATYEKVVGIKDSSGDMSYFNMLLGAIDRPDFCFFTGPEILLAETIAVGGDGAVCGGANLYPHLFVNQYNAAKKEDTLSIRQNLKIMRAIHRDLYGLSSYGSSFLRSLKTAMALKGICKNVLLPPYFPFTGEEVNAVKKVIEGLEKKYAILGMVK